MIIIRANYTAARFQITDTIRLARRRVFQTFRVTFTSELRLEIVRTFLRRRTSKAYIALFSYGNPEMKNSESFFEHDDRIRMGRRQIGKIPNGRVEQTVPAMSI